MTLRVMPPALRQQDSMVRPREVQIEALADALVYAGPYINCRSLEDQNSRYDDGDVGALERIAALGVKQGEPSDAADRRDSQAFRGSTTLQPCRVLSRVARLRTGDTHLMARNACHSRLRELPRGLRRLFVLLAIGTTWSAFTVFLMCIAFWVWLKHQPSDGWVLAILTLIASAVGIGHGTAARLRLKDAESGEFVSTPSVLDLSLLALSSMMVFLGGCIAIGAH